jgi:hypothetical protein
MRKRKKRKRKKKERKKKGVVEGVKSTLHVVVGFSDNPVPHPLESSLRGP